jgi:hypothetical protein
MVAVSSLSVGAVRLDGFVHVHIQKYGFAFVVENYNPIREQYYAQKEDNLKTKRKDGQNVPSSSCTK